MKKKILGHDGFTKEYWDKNYYEPEEMDGIANAGVHAKYLKAFFDIEYIDISSVIDFGFGLGHLFEEVLKEFMPYKAVGIEPSEHAFNIVKERGISPIESTNLKLQQMDLYSWCQKNKEKKKRYDLGICTSVFQYLSDEVIVEVLPVLADKVKYLYFSVPTDLELERQVSDLEFKDEYALHRKQKKYLKFLKPHFSVVGARLLESKVHFNEEDTLLTDLLFRF